MSGRVHSREFKLTLVRQLASGEKRPAQLCREHNLALQCGFALEK
jgi:putative transposase